MSSPAENRRWKLALVASNVAGGLVREMAFDMSDMLKVMTAKTAVDIAEPILVEIEAREVAVVDELEASEN